MSWESRLGLSAVVAVLIGAYCYTTYRQEREYDMRKAWWSTMRIVVLSGIAVFIASGLLLTAKKPATGGMAGGEAAIEPLTHAMSHIDKSATAPF